MTASMSPARRPDAIYLSPVRVPRFLVTFAGDKRYFAELRCQMVRICVFHRMLLPLTALSPAGSYRNCFL